MSVSLPFPTLRQIHRIQAPSWTQAEQEEEKSPVSSLSAPSFEGEKSAVMEPLEMHTSTHRCQAGTFNSGKKGAQMSCIAAIQSLGIFLDTDTIITEHWQKGKSNLQVTLPGEGKPSFLFISYKHFLFIGSLTSSRNTLKTITEANCLLQWIKRCVLPFRPT